MNVPKILEKPKALFCSHKKVSVVGLIVLVAVVAYFMHNSSSNKTSFLTQKIAYGDIKQMVSCTGVVQPVQSVNITFKNSGLLQNILVHEGDKVTAGQVLANQSTSDYEIKLAQAEASQESAQANLSKIQQGTRPETLAQTQASLSEAEANMNQAKNNLDREEQLYQAGAEAKATYEQTETAYKVAEQRYLSVKAQYEQQVNGNLPQDVAAAQAQVKTATAQLQSAQNDLNNTKMTAPFDGYISLINGEIGQWTPGGAPPNSTGSTMFYITLVSKELQLSCQVNEADIGQLKVGQTATFTVNAFPNKNFSATVKSIAPQATTISNVQMFNVVLATQENESLKAGMPVNVNIVTDSRSHVLRVPMAAMNFTKTFSGSTSYSSANGQNRSEQGARSNGNQAGGSTVGNNGSNNRSNNDNGGMQRDRSANGGVTRSGGGEQVLVLKNGVPTRVRITTGLKDDVSAEVTQGLQEGDEVIVGSTTPGGTSGTQGGANRSQQNQRSQGMPGLGMPRIRS